MTTKEEKGYRHIYLIIFIVMGLVALFYLAIVVGSLSTMGLLMSYAFIDEFVVINNTDENIYITPIGMWQGNGKYGPLPRRNKNLFRKSLKNSNLYIPAGSRINIVYDAGDVNFRHILIKATNEIFILDTDKKGTLDSCYAAQRDRYVIPSLSQLKKVDSELSHCFYGDKIKYSKKVEYQN
jgi:hypothetical protein